MTQHRLSVKSDLIQYSLKCEETGRELGHGSYATVTELSYKGLKCAGKNIHKVLYRQQPKETLVARFVAECKLISELRHPNIVQFLGVYFEPDETPVLVMEYVPITLAECLDRYGIMPDEISYSILTDVILGLRYLHEQATPIIHRDLSANNVLLTENFTAKISDLGVAKIVDVPISRISRLTSVPGTPCYMPPEALIPSPNYNISIDIFSYGILIIHIFSGQWPLPNEATKLDPNMPNSLIPVSESDRRSNYLDIMGTSHPLLALTRSCLNNNSAMRPKAMEIWKVLVEVTSQHQPSYRNKLDMLLRLAEKSDSSSGGQKVGGVAQKAGGMAQKAGGVAPKWGAGVEPPSPTQKKAEPKSYENTSTPVRAWPGASEKTSPPQERVWGDKKITPPQEKAWGDKISPPQEKAWGNKKTTPPGPPKRAGLGDTEKKKVSPTPPDKPKTRVEENGGKATNGKVLPKTSVRPPRRDGSMRVSHDKPQMEESKGSPWKEREKAERGGLKDNPWKEREKAEREGLKDNPWKEREKAERGVVKNSPWNGNGNGNGGQTHNEGREDPWRKIRDTPNTTQDSTEQEPWKARRDSQRRKSNIADNWLTKNTKPTTPTDELTTTPDGYVNMQGQQSAEWGAGRAEKPVPAAAAPVAVRKTMATVLYDFVGRNEEELSIAKGDVIEILEAEKEGGSEQGQWLKAKKNFKEGTVPSTYIELLPEEPTQQMPTQQKLLPEPPKQVTGTPSGVHLRARNLGDDHRTPPTGNRKSIAINREEFSQRKKFVESLFGIAESAGPAPGRQMQQHTQQQQQQQQQYTQQNTSVYVALYDYNAADEDEVSFRKGDEAVDATYLDEGWMEGTIKRTGQYGMLPYNYFQQR